MATAAYESSLEPAPIKSQARRAGLLYFAAGFTAPFALLVVPKKIFVAGDAAATADRIRAGRSLVELGIAAELLNCTVLVLALLALYRLFRRVSEPLAAAMAALFLVSIPLQLANLLPQMAALMVTSEPSWLAAFSRQQLDGLAYTFVEIHARGIQLAGMFWGLWLIPYGLVIRRSGFIPAWLSVPLMVAGIAYVVGSITGLFFPEYTKTLSPIMLVLGLGEIPILVWLIGWGAKTQWTSARWSTQP